MDSCTAIAPPEAISVGMGQIEWGKGPVRLVAVLGSCVGLALYHRRTRTGMLAHVVLPDSAGRAASPGKFADTAVVHMLELFARQGVSPSSVAAKIVGGARMFGTSGPMRIGESNIEAVTQRLAEAGIRIAARDTGGAKGRRICLDCLTGTLTVETVGKRHDL